MARLAAGFVLTLCSLLSVASARGQDTASVASHTIDGGDQGPLVLIAAIDSDAVTEIVKQLEIRGYEPRREGLDVALRGFAADHELELPEKVGYVAARTLDALEAGRAVALRWGGRGPRAPELSADEIWRLNAALRLREYTTREPRTAVDAETLAALRAFQRATGHPVQKGELIERRWLFILGVATEESIPRTAPTPPAAPPR